jgi:SAM-dependent methyltransferase
MSTPERAPNTIEDFGEQWTQYPDNTGFYGSAPEVLDGLFGPLLDRGSLTGKAVADVGAGTGRYTRLLHAAGARVFALEPSAAFAVLQRNTRDLEGVEYLQAPAEAIPAGRFDLVFCVGVLQFIPDPQPALRAMGRALRPGGELFLWVYGRENNGLYLALVKPLRAVTSRLPHKVLDRLAAGLAHVAGGYARLCRATSLPLPMARYLRDYYSRLDFYSRKLVVYDQLNPRLARYYRQEELRALLAGNGYTDIRLYHRLGYSWSVLARYGESP